LASRAAAAPGLIALALAVAGCGQGGTSSGATVHVYAAASLCRGAQHEVRKAGREAGDLQVRVVCLAPTVDGSRAELATTGANARRATEDSASVAFLEAPGPVAKFSRSVVESADVAWISTGSGSVAVRQVLQALGGRGSASPRDAVREALG
jgi:hypothetical protein